MKTGMSFQRMAAALPYVMEITQDEKFKGFKQKIRDDEGAVSVADAMSILLPALLVDKPGTVLGLLGAMNGKTAEEIADQEWEETKAQMADPACLNDIQDFFTFSLRMARSA